MPNPNDEMSQTAAAIAGLTAALERMELRYEAARRAERRLRIGLFLVTLLVLAAAALFAFSSTRDLLNQIAPPRLAESDPAAAQERRERLLAALPPEELERVRRFETQVRLVREYMDASPEFDTGATVALVLSNMNRSIEVMPEMYLAVEAMAEEMRAINGRMANMDRKLDALPVLATEVQIMRAQVGVLAAGVDSTMGRAGRMMPWAW